MPRANDHLTNLLQPVVEAMGYEWVGLEYLSGLKGSGLLRIYIDTEGGITLDDCSAVSHQVSGVLDVEDPIRENYRLEVSSPGLDRPLFTQEHYQRFAGHPVSLKLHGKWNNRRKLVGQLRGCDGEQVAMTLEGEEIQVPLDMINSARLVPDFNETER
ncbi:MAG: ribosome maturation factor RimP [Gammaproteobacteria bacterium SHHR-1]|uniref:ribosome maturation factor RimP n=1 Tax=Magnetovirga frankeli TaxID=947516 RepID=UPI001293D079|nr:ribosome maturation factor RimP [gamma proteobacterium SS-5]